MIVVVEGPSAAGKTTWVAEHYSQVAVWEYQKSGGEPNRETDAEEAAAFWGAANSDRWLQALAIESAHGMAVCDTDPLKLHYVWCLWQVGEASKSAWLAEASINRRKFDDGKLGFADLVICEFPAPDELEGRRTGDTARKRSSFAIHARLAAPLKEWYLAVDSLDPGRVRWSLPQGGPLPNLPTPRNERSDPELLERLLDSLQAS